MWVGCALEILINEKETLINLYGPNNDDPAFFEQLENYIRENNEKTFIVGGDFNTVINENIEPAHINFVANNQ